MARGVKKTTDEKIQELRAAVAREEEKLRELKRQLSERMQEKQAEEAAELLNLIGELGMTVEEAGQILGENAKGQASA